MMGLSLDILIQIALKDRIGILRGFRLADADSVAYPMDVRVDSDIWSIVEDSYHDFRSLDSYSRECHEGIQVGRNDRIIPADKDLCTSFDRLRFVAEEIQSGEIGLDCLERQYHEIGGSFHHFEKRLRKTIHMLVGRLRGKYHRNQELERSGIFQLRFQSREEGIYPLQYHGCLFFLFHVHCKIDNPFFSISILSEIGYYQK